MTRIISGRWRGHPIEVPSRGTRPTSDRVREAIFSRLAHVDAITDAIVLDLFAGSGALGLEAVSRGAAHCVLVDSAAAATQVMRRNIRALKAGEVSTMKASASDYVTRPAPRPWDLVFADPPYDLDTVALDAILAQVAESMAPDAVLVVERTTRSAPPAPIPRFGEPVRKVYGETAVYYFGA